MRKRIVFLCVGGMALFVAAPARAVERGATADVTSIERLQGDFANAWSRDDVKGMAAVFSDDADLINPMGDRAQGNAEVAKLLGREHAAALRQTSFSTRCEAPRFLAPTLALVTCPFKIENVKGPNGPSTAEGVLTEVLSKDNGRWHVRVARPMYPTPMPGSNAPSQAPRGTSTTP